ncbi:hypothetical protein L6452_44205 [Arctium lappa]|uniref:Uncharacterized protein n=1 Tax=Arctium lappa TaxID=4217 RepID=A0ACB8XF05_ARCLA|nr:hypothetical protein L6452_44205 [Arctium lappa]
MSIARFPSFIYRSSILAHLHRFSIRHRFSGTIDSHCNPPLLFCSLESASGLLGIARRLRIEVKLGRLRLKLRGTNVLRYLGRTTTTIPSLYQGDAFEIGQIDEWLDYAPIFSSGSEYEGACKYVDGYLLQRTFLVGHSLSIADMAVWSYLAEARLKMEEDARQDREARKALERLEQFEALVRQFRSSSAPPSPRGLVCFVLG